MRVAFPGAPSQVAVLQLGPLPASLAKGQEG